jgi:hypothetical protein
MEKYKLTEIRDKNDYKISYIWHPGVIPEGVPVQQVYGFCSTKDNLVALVREKDDSRFTPPGAESKREKPHSRHCTESSWKRRSLCQKILNCLGRWKL